MATAMKNGVRLSQTSPAFLHANSTSHTWVFSAIAELIDNAYDPDCDATQLWIDKKKIYGYETLIFTDNGNGLTSEKLHKMLSFGYCDKVDVGNHKTVGQYGNGFKSGSMRLGKDAIVFTKSKKTMSVGLLSQTYLKNIAAETVLVPIVTWDHSKSLSKAPDGIASLKAITQHSPFKSEQELMKEFEALANFKTGTRIFIYNLKKDSDNRLELDFVSDPTDIINGDRASIDLTTSTTDRPVKEYTPEYKRSLRHYCSILFLKPKMKIFIRGSKVKTKYVAKSLSKTETDVYRPVKFGHLKPIKIIFGFGPSKNDYGIMMYTRNRLIKAFERVGYQKQANELGVGVVGVVEVDFLEPIHNKQDYNKTAEYNACMNALGQKLNDYYNEKCNIPEGEGTVLEITPDTHVPLPDWNWAQCDNPKCLKWRRLPPRVNPDSLPEKWFCYMNSDPTHNRCDIEEEPEDEDELYKSTYEKTYRKRQEIERKKKAEIELEKQKQREEEYKRNKEELRKMKSKIQELTPLEDEVSSSQEVKPTVADLENTRRELEEMKQREHEHRKTIEYLRNQKEEIMRSQHRFNEHVMKEATTLRSLNQKSAITSASDSTQVTSTSTKRKHPFPTIALGPKKKKVAEGEDFVITENTSDSEEEKSNKNNGSKEKPIADTVIVLQSDSEDETERNDEATCSKEDVKPDKEQLDKEMETASNTKQCKQEPKTPKKSDKNSSPKNKNSVKTENLDEEGTSKSEQKTVNKYAQTVQAAGNEEINEEMQQKLEETESQLLNLRTNVSKLLRIIVPDLDNGALEHIDEIVVEMIRVNGEESGATSTVDDITEKGDNIATETD